MNIRALLVDFKVFAPIDINYQRALDQLAKDYGQFIKSAPTDVTTQIELIKEKAKKKDFDEFAPRISKLLDEIEISQVGDFSLNMGVKYGLAALDELDVSVVALTDIGKVAAEKFLKEKGIDSFIGKLVARDTIGEPFDLGSRLNRALGKDELKQGECVYFCNKLADLKLAKACNFSAIVLPSKGEKLDLMMLEKPLGMIMSLEEIPNLLSLEIARTAKPKSIRISSEEMESGQLSGISSSESNDSGSEVASSDQ